MQPKETINVQTDRRSSKQIWKGKKTRRKQKLRHAQINPRILHTPLNGGTNGTLDILLFGLGVIPSSRPLGLGPDISGRTLADLVEPLLMWDLRRITLCDEGLFG